MKRGALAIWRCLRLLAHALHGLLVVLLVFPRLTQQQQQARVQAWALKLVTHAGVTLEVRGEPVLAGPVLMVANHLSWLDIPVLHAARYCRFISKSDVRDWPIVGALATAAGTLYIERTSRRDALRMVQSMHEALEQREVLAVFPEGTTGNGRELLPFHANLLQAAITAQAPVQPIGIRFADRHTGEVSYAPSYVDDETLLGSIWRTLVAPPLVAVVHYGALEMPDDQDRRTWSQHLHARVDALRKD
ncbi:lysophospholipid acyltransferase family protein [Diaphorobacter aerolatus]|uniref:1-acyl-sn-glycerol-3-phosphate acyltransferase n=1 Tax=Diaphorobacter aerolatus TaxID=1288495 RepID=A0A7H0GHN4_9BURK|nr:lysophospholipid acyltransferase family protein [Diaphorobacter aerolatus]QNP47800.1 1-acyl-sn-glycerol-3-phosphate acyltransferase [Diaphorobacter aerolatus]